MVDALRERLPQTLPHPVSHAGLELTRYVKKIESGGDQGERRTLFTRLAAAAAPPIYEKAYRRWEGSLARPDVRTAVARSHDGLLVGLGAESVLETALTLHHIYGTPLIPGSALKGLARHYFEQAVLPGGIPLADADKHRTMLFGRADAAGYVTYHDAWYVPEGNGHRPLRLDVLTPHHPRYNAASPAARTAPTDFDDPNPVSFLRAQGSYLIAVRGPNAACAEFALALLLQALADYGVGGKTSSGYGRLTCPAANVASPPVVPRLAKAPGLVTPDAPPDLPASPVPAPIATPSLPVPLGVTTFPATLVPESALQQQIEAMPAGQVYAQLGRLGKQWSRLPKGTERQSVGIALYKRLGDANLLNNFQFEDEQWVITLKGEVKSAG